ncbi:MAG: hypothetical protein WD969_15190 [Paracoccaceae bacterium]
MARTIETLPAAFPEIRFRAFDGETELAIAEAAASAGSRPARVTAVLSAICAEVAGEPGGYAVIRRVCAAGREWLLQRAALHLYGDGAGWFEASCPTCGATFDLRVALDRVPRAEPGSGFPVAEVETSLGLRRFETPNGAHEEAFCAREGDPRRVFAALCGHAERAEAEAIRFDEADLERIDMALEAASPEIADGVDARCPACGAETMVRIEPLDFAFPRLDDIFREVHRIAAAYRWREPDILALPVHRRRAYAALIRGDARAAAGRLM